MDGFPVTLYLNRFLNDHRSICKIFINLDKMETIKDLQDHITQTFNINNFYLMVHNQFLPSTENIRVLRPDDMISAIPLQVSFGGGGSTNNNCESTKNSVNVDNEEKCVGKKRKKKVKNVAENSKKIKHLCSSSWINDADEEDNNGKITSTPLETKLSNKTEELCREKSDEFEIKPKNRVKDKVAYFKKQIDHFANPIINTEKSQPSKEENSQLEAPINLDKEEIVQIADIMRKQKLYVKPNDCFKKISTELPQQHNVVKSIIVSMDTSQEHNTSGRNSVVTSRSQSSAENTCNTIHKDIREENKINVLQQIIITPKKATENSLEALKNVTNSVSPESHPVIYDKLSESQPQVEQFVTKRKRVRVRKRKSKEVKLDSNIVVPNFDFKMKIPTATPAIHIKFDEDGNEEKCHITIETEEEVPNISTKNSDMKEFISNEEEANHIPEISVQKETSEAIVETEKDFVKYVSETIDKYCLLIDSMPQIGNIIAFKLLKLSISFTPELSNYIIGKVLDVSEDKKSITVKVLDGLEEAKNPIEDFSLNYENLHGSEIENTFTYEWSHLKETRLLS